MCYKILEIILNAFFFREQPKNRKKWQRQTEAYYPGIAQLPLNPDTINSKISNRLS